MPDYTLYYWSVPFRGQFVRAVLAHAGKAWDEVDDAEIGRVMDAGFQAMPVPFMGPPVLVDHKSDVALAQMPAIVLYLGETLGLLPDDAARRALTLKTVNDANDVIDEITLNGGEQMWTDDRWKQFRPRLAKWLAIWEQTGRRHGLTREKGFLLGGDHAWIADVVTATLWTTLADRFDKVAALLESEAPMTAALAHRISRMPAQAALAARARHDYGDAYCGGEIGASMQKVLG